MFCNYCGAEIQADQKFCAACGKAVIGAAAPAAAAAVTSAAPAAAGRVASHLRVLGALWLVFSGLRVLRGLGNFVGARVMRLVGDSWFEGFGWGWSVPHFVPRMLSVFGAGLLILAIVGFIAGWGLLERREWARTLAIVLAVIALLSPLLGTALGIYTLWVLLPARSEEEWRRMTRPA